MDHIKDKVKFMTNLAFFFIAIPLAIFVGYVYYKSENPGPVMGKMKASFFHREGEWVFAHITGIKARNCVLVKNSWYGYARAEDNIIQEVPFEFRKSLSNGASKPAGRHDFGIWAWKEIKAKEVWISILHICPEGKVQTDIGPFNVEEKTNG